MRCLLAVGLLASGLGSAGEPAGPVPPGDRVLWRAPHSMTDEDWAWGPGGKERAPVPPFQFVKENLGGTNPKIDIRDARGERWSIKFGSEVHPEVFASRFLNATGYAAEATYFVAEGVISGVTGLR